MPIAQPRRPRQDLGVPLFSFMCECGRQGCWEAAFEPCIYCGYEMKFSGDYEPSLLRLCGDLCALCLEPREDTIKIIIAECLEEAKKLKDEEEKAAKEGRVVKEEEDSDYQQGVMPPHEDVKPIVKEEEQDEEMQYGEVKQEFDEDEESFYYNADLPVIPQKVEPPFASEDMKADIEREKRMARILAQSDTVGPMRQTRVKTEWIREIKHRSAVVDGIEGIRNKEDFEVLQIFRKLGLPTREEAYRAALSIAMIDPPTRSAVIKGLPKISGVLKKDKAAKVQYLARDHPELVQEFFGDLAASTTLLCLRAVSDEIVKMAKDKKAYRMHSKKDKREEVRERKEEQMRKRVAEGKVIRKRKSYGWSK